MQTKLTKAVERFIEDELYHFIYNVQELRDVKDDIYDGSSSDLDGMPHGTDVSNPTEQKVMRLLTTRQILSLEKRLSSIERVIQRYRSNHAMSRLIELRYFKRTHTPQGIMEELHISQATYYKWRRELLEDIASEMGLF